MEKAIKFLGVCILLSVIIVSATLVYININSRYKVVGTKVFDTHIGEFLLETTSEPIQTKLEYTEDEAKALIDMQKAGENITPYQKRIINDYYKKQRILWAEEFKKDAENGKVKDYSEYDYDRIIEGQPPKGYYIDIKNAPDWYKELINYVEIRPWTEEDVKRLLNSK